MEITRRGFLGTAAVAAMPALAQVGEDRLISKKAPAGAKLGALGKIVGELPPGRYDSHIHIMHGDPDPEAFYSSLREAGLRGAAVFSRPPRKTSKSQPDPLPPEKTVDQLIEWCSAAPTLYPFYYINPADPAAIDNAVMAAEKGVYGFKIIHNDGLPCQPAFIPLYRKIAELGRPITFHTGILWDGLVSSDFFRPANWEGMLNVPKIRFATCHISWPWVDECIAVYGKLLNAITRNGWETVPEMFIDITPGTPKIYRREALAKLHTVGYDVFDHIMFGTDCRVKPYNVGWSKDWQATDDAIYAELGLEAKVIDSCYRTALQRYLFGGDNSNRRAPTADGLSRKKL